MRQGCRFPASPKLFQREISPKVHCHSRVRVCRIEIRVLIENECSYENTSHDSAFGGVRLGTTFVLTSVTEGMRRQAIEPSEILTFRVPTSPDWGEHNMRNRERQRGQSAGDISGSENLSIAWKIQDSGEPGDPHWFPALSCRTVSEPLRGHG